MEGVNFDLKLICLQGKEPLQLQERRFLRWYLSVMCITAPFSQVPQGKTEAFKWRAASSFSATSGMYVYIYTHTYRHMLETPVFALFMAFLAFALLGLQCNTWEKVAQWRQHPQHRPKHREPQAPP